MPTVSPEWSSVKPFVPTSGSQFRPAAPIALLSAEWAAKYNEIKDFGALASAKRSARRTEDARFWTRVHAGSHHRLEYLLEQIAVAKPRSG
jgi:hypothetical protein